MRKMTNIPAEDYHAIKALSKSGLDQLAKSPAHYAHWLQNPNTEPTEAMRIGTAVHMAVLEPEKFRLKYALFSGDRRTKDGKAAYEALLSTGVEPLNADAWEQINGIAASVRSHPWWIENVTDSETEVSFFDLFDGIDVKARMDGITARHIIDLKTTSDASPAGFAKSVANFRYHWQAAWYQQFVDLPFVFIAVEKEPPYAVGIYTLDADAIAIANADISVLLANLKDCQAFGSMPGYRSDIVTLSLPKFVKTIEA